MKTALLRGGVLACAALFMLTRLPVRADYLGAAAVLEKVAAASNAEAKPKEKPSEFAKFKQDVEAFKKRSASLTAEDAAREWLALLDRSSKLPSPSSMPSMMSDVDYESQNSQAIWLALPPPAAWDALRTAVETRPPAKGKAQARESALRLFVHTLVADRPAQLKDIAEMEALFTKLDRNDAYYLASVLDRIGEVLMESSDDAESTMKMLERRLARVSGDNASQLRVPDLVSLVGKERAETFLRRALVKPGITLEIENGEATQKLARRLALELVDQLKSPPWALAQSMDAVALYEALEKKFAPTEEPAETDTNSIPTAAVNHQEALGGGFGDKENAQNYYFLGLIAEGRTKDAIAVAKKISRGYNSLPRDALKALERAGRARNVHKFFHELLTQDPDLPFWDEYIELSAKLGETEKMLELARAAAARSDLGKESRNLIRQNLYKALLAADHVDEGIKELRDILSRKEKIAGRYQPANYGRTDLALNLASLGQLLKRPELIEEGIRYAYEASTNKSPSPGYYQSDSSRLPLKLLELNRGAEAESWLLEEMSSVPQNSGDANPWSARASAPNALIALAEIYRSAGRPGDVIVLLDQSPDWGVKDIKDLSRYSGYYNFHQRDDAADLKLSRFTAEALLAAGRTTEAKKIIEEMLNRDAGFDPAYELLIQSGGDDVLSRLDTLFGRDQFEERPLIWKAHLLFKAGKLEDAEAVVRRAIAIDPSDGEQGPDRRMRAYAVLADIREARGDKKQADFFRGAVTAIRLSEKADLYAQAGLLKQAVKMYEESLTHFADAYCIQSRLALQLSELGMHELAEEHYKRAYELMPDSFGRVESHCFGCERAFDGERAQSIAEKVFTGVVAASPNKPQAHYLLGYLREEQGRYPEALASYRTAVKLDPDYLNAWKKIETISAYLRLPAAERDAVALNIQRLDPLHHHGSARFGDITNLRELWNVLESAAKLLPPPAESIYPLAASKAKLEKKEKENKQQQRAMSRFTYYSQDFSGSDDRLQPAAAVLQNGFIAATTMLLSSGGGFDDE